MDKLGLGDSRLHIFNAMILLATFGYFRCIWGPQAAWAIYTDIKSAWNVFEYNNDCLLKDMAVSLGIPLDKACREELLPNWLAILVLSTNLVLIGLNYFWYSKMLTRTIGRFGKSGRRVPVAEKLKEK